MSKSFKAEVQADSSGTWSSNALRFAHQREAEYYAADLWARWSAVRARRVVESDDAPTHLWDGDRAVPIPAGGVS
jgi:hypothetical protein